MFVALETKGCKRTQIAVCSTVPYKCGKTFTQMIDLEQHLLIPAGERPYICDNLCYKAFKKSRYLKWYQLTHGSSQPRAPDYTRKRKYKCDQCGTALLTSNHLRNHQVIQTGEKPHSCDRCEESFSMVNTLKNTSSFIQGEVLPLWAMWKRLQASADLLSQQISHTIKKSTPVSGVGGSLQP